MSSIKSNVDYPVGDYSLCFILRDSNFLRRFNLFINIFLFFKSQNSDHFTLDSVDEIKWLKNLSFLSYSLIGYKMDKSPFLFDWLGSYNFKDC